jgi:hypothetical protein
VQSCSHKVCLCITYNNVDDRRLSGTMGTRYMDLIIIYKSLQGGCREKLFNLKQTVFMQNRIDSYRFARRSYTISWRSSNLDGLFYCIKTCMLNSSSRRANRRRCRVTVRICTVEVFCSQISDKISHDCIPCKFELPGTCCKAVMSKIRAYTFNCEFSNLSKGLGPF